MTKLGRYHGRNFDLVIACDNAVPHLLSDAAILKAFREAKSCLRPQGSYLITVRDYDNEDKTAVQFRPYGIRKTKDATYTLFQTWHFKGLTYDVALYTLEERPGKAIRTHVARATYYAVGVGRLMALMKKAGFSRVKRIDGAYFQPVIAGTKGGAAR
jgi:SAM-dependent methyltransferase